MKVGLKDGGQLNGSFGLWPSRERRPADELYHIQLYRRELCTCWNEYYEVRDDELTMKMRKMSGYTIACS